MSGSSRGDAKSSVDNKQVPDQKDIVDYHALVQPTIGQLPGLHKADQVIAILLIPADKVILAAVTHCIANESKIDHFSVMRWELTDKVENPTKVMPNQPVYFEIKACRLFRNCLVMGTNIEGPGTIGIWNIDTGKLDFQYDSHDLDLDPKHLQDIDAARTPSGDFLFSLCYDPETKVSTFHARNLNTQEIIHTVTSSDFGPALKVLQNGTCCIHDPAPVSSTVRFINIWDYRNNKMKQIKHSTLLCETDESIVVCHADSTRGRTTCFESYDLNSFEVIASGTDFGSGLGARPIARFLSNGYLQIIKGAPDYYEQTGSRSWPMLLNANFQRIATLRMCYAKMDFTFHTLGFVANAKGEYLCDGESPVSYCQQYNSPGAEKIVRLGSPKERSDTITTAFQSIASYLSTSLIRLVISYDNQCDFSPVPFPLRIKNPPPSPPTSREWLLLFTNYLIFTLGSSPFPKIITHGSGTITEPGADLVIKAIHQLQEEQKKLNQSVSNNETATLLEIERQITNIVNTLKEDLHKAEYKENATTTSIASSMWQRMSDIVGSPPASASKLIRYCRDAYSSLLRENLFSDLFGISNQFDVAQLRWLIKRLAQEKVLAPTSSHKNGADEKSASGQNLELQRKALIELVTEYSTFNHFNVYTTDPYYRDKVRHIRLGMDKLTDIFSDERAVTSEEFEKMKKVVLKEINCWYLTSDKNDEYDEKLIKSIVKVLRLPFISQTTITLSQLDHAISERVRAMEANPSDAKKKPLTLGRRGYGGNN